MRVIAANHPIRSDIITVDAASGSTVEQLVAQAQPDPILRGYAHVFIGDIKVPRDKWARVRPRESSVVTIKMVPQGGGGDKNPLRTVLTIAVVVVASIATGGAAAAGWGAAAQAAVGAAVTVAGNLLVNAIAPIRPPSMDGLSGTGKRDSPALSIEGARNIARAFGTVPVVLGRHRHVPPLGAQTYTEIIGDDQYLRMLVVWGYGPLKIENLRIGETPIENFDGVRVQTREGRSGDSPVTIYPNEVAQEDTSILLKQVDSWQTRTAPPDADELSIDITFPRGHAQFSDDGKKQTRLTSVQFQYREVGTSTWINPTITDSTVPSSWILISQAGFRQVSFTQRKTSAIRHGFRWSVSRGNYEIRVRRVSEDTNDNQILDQVNWTAYRSFTNGNPIQFRHPLAITALSIKATDQLNGVVDRLNADVSSYATDFDGSEVVSSNPALLYRHVLQGNANARAMGDADIDLDTLSDWADYCDTEGFEFNMIRDFQASVWDTLADIASTGRASPSQRDGKWSVVVDQVQDFPVQHFTPRNSWGFEAEKTFPDPPDAFRVRFANRDVAWRQDERIVYADGFDESNAEVFETLDTPGITDSDHVWKFARFHLAQSILRPERWTINVDFEHLVARRGSLVRVTHDVLLVGLASGRVVEVFDDGGGNATGFRSDELLPGLGDTHQSYLVLGGELYETTDQDSYEVTFESGTEYGVSVRNVDDAGLSIAIQNTSSDGQDVFFESSIPLADAPQVGDLFGFGERGSETIEALILSVEPESDLVARLTLIPYSPAVYDSDTGVIPEYDTGITPLQEVPAIDITGVRTGENVVTLGAGNTLIPHAAIQFASPVDYEGLLLDVQVRPSGTGESYSEATVAKRSGNEVWIGEVEEGESYDFRLRWRDTQRVVTGQWATVSSQIVTGSLNPPQGLQGLTISAFGGGALLRWDRAPEIDVRVGGRIEFRHSQAINPASANWNNSTSIGDGASGGDQFAQLPLKPGTYLARVFDRGGRPSTGIAKISTKQASVLPFAGVDSVTESPTFPGTHDNTTTVDGSLWLQATGQFDDIEDFDQLSSLDSFGGITTQDGFYTFAGGFDLTTVTRVRLTSVIDATAVNVEDLIDDRTELIDTWEDFDGTQSASSDARVQVRHTDDDPSGTPTWGDWNNLDSAEFEARGFQFRVKLTTNDPAYNIRVDELGVVAEEFIQ